MDGGSAGSLIGLVDGAPSPGVALVGARVSVWTPCGVPGRVPGVGVSDVVLALFGYDLAGRVLSVDMGASMSDLRLKDLMVPVGDYASVPLGASIREGIVALKEAQRREFQNEPERHRDRAVLVKDSKGEVVGKLSMWSIIGCLEPSFSRVKGGAASSMAASRIGSARGVIEEIMGSSHLWRRRLSTIAGDTAELKIRDLLHEPRKSELIDEGSSLERAIHLLVVGHLMSLLVTRDHKIVGILRLVDVFELVCDRIGDEAVQLYPVVPIWALNENQCTSCASGRPCSGLCVRIA